MWEGGQKDVPLALGFWTCILCEGSCVGFLVHERFPGGLLRMLSVRKS